MNRRYFSIAVNGLCLLLLAGISLYLLLNWYAIPPRIPGHYNAAGEVDRWSGRGVLIFQPALGWVLYIGLTVLEHFPGLWNTGVRVTPQNHAQVYHVLRTLLETQKLWAVATFAYLAFNTAQARPLGIWFLPVFLTLGLGSLGACLIWLYRIGNEKN